MKILFEDVFAVLYSLVSVSDCMSLLPENVFFPSHSICRTNKKQIRNKESDTCIIEDIYAICIK